MKVPECKLVISLRSLCPLRFFYLRHGKGKGVTSFELYKILFGCTNS